MSIYVDLYMLPYFNTALIKLKIFYISLSICWLCFLGPRLLDHALSEREAAFHALEGDTGDIFGVVNA